MSYAQKFKLFRESLIKHCKHCVSENWDKMFDMWLIHEADMEFGYGYQDKYKEQFGDYITEETKLLLWFSGKNIIYAVNSFISLHGYELDELLKFVEKFVSEQLDDFGNNFNIEYNETDEE